MSVEFTHQQDKPNGDYIMKNELKIGGKYNIGRGVVVVVTGRCNVGYTAQQEYKGKVHDLVIPEKVINNPHYSIQEVV